MQRQTDHAQNSNPTKKARLAECLKIINGIMIYIKPTTPDTNTNTKTKAKKHSSTDVITTLHHVLYYLKMELDRISSSPTNLDLMLNYILNDLKAVATKTDNLVRKYDKTFWSSHVKRKKYEYKITLMDNRLHYIYTLLSYYFTNKIDDKTKTYSFSAPYVISDKEAAEFWTRNFGDNYWYKEYDPFCDAIKTKNEKAYKMLTSNSDKTMKYPQVVTAISFGLATDKGFKAFFNGLSYNNPFLVPASTASDPDPTAIPEDTGNDAERESEYFYIFSRCITEDKRKYCVQVSDKEPGSNIVIGELNYSDAQQWKWGENGSLINRMSMLAIDIDGRDPKSGKKLVQWPADGSATQMWLIGNDGYIHSGPALNEPICFDLDKGATTIGTPCLLWNIIPGRANQLWRVSPVMNKIFKKYVDED